MVHWEYLPFIICRVLIRLKSHGDVDVTGLNEQPSQHESKSQHVNVL